jgi:predicted deacylase
MIARPIELVAPDIERWSEGNGGTDYVWRFDSEAPGPAVMVQALTHGNEICGAIALDWLLEQLVAPPPGQPGLMLASGTLTIAFGNVDAYAQWNPDDPDRSRYVDEDYNRVWADDVLAAPRDSAELRRARALRPFVAGADLLLDIHSMHEPCQPIMVCGAAGRGGEKSADFARRLGVPEYLLIDTGHPAGLRMIEHGAFGRPHDPRTAILIECGQHWERRAAAVAMDTLLRFLRLAGSLSAESADPLIAANGVVPGPTQRLVVVTDAVVAMTPDFQFLGPFTGLEVIPKAGDPIARDGDRIIRAPYDDTVLVMPSLAQRAIGTTMVRLGRIVPSASSTGDRPGIGP